MQDKTQTDKDGLFSYEGLDRVLHEKARLGMLTSLAAHPKGLAFGDLKQLCGLTDGNLSRHLKVLEEARIVEIKKGYERNRPLTTCRLTPQGRTRFLDYINVLEQVVRDAEQAIKPTSKKTKLKTNKPPLNLKPKPL